MLAFIHIYDIAVCLELGPELFSLGSSFQNFGRGLYDIITIKVEYSPRVGVEKITFEYF